MHVFLDAFNDTNKYVAKEKWQIGDHEFDAFIGNFNIKSSSNSKIEIPEDLFTTIQHIITQYNLTEEYYFIRFFYGHSQNKTMTIEFMINNISLEKEKERLQNLNFMKSKEYYSIRNFLILKKNTVTNNSYN